MSNKLKVLFLGVGGVSMYQLALAYKDLGYDVVGYDMKHSQYTDILENANIPVYYEIKNCPLHVNFCIKTGAIKDKHPIIKKLKNLEVNIIDRAIALGEICKHFKTVIAVAGTHGKSTTASLIYSILREAGKQVSCHIGAYVFNPRFQLGDEFLVVEACEYNRSFLSLYHTISVVTNVEPDHMESYGTIFNLRSAFTSFMRAGSVRFVMKNETTEFLKKIKNVQFVSRDDVGISPRIKGEYNMENISLARAVARSLNIDEDSINRSVNSFVGVPRRYEEIGRIASQHIYIDYAHHPSEIKAFVSAFKQEYPNSLIVFQPHTYSRTKLLFADFMSVLSNVDDLVIYKEYPAREKRSAGMSAKELYVELKKLNKNVKYASNQTSVNKYMSKYDAVAFVGAGDIEMVAKNLVLSAH